MKKLLLLKKLIIVVLLVGLSSAGWAQVLLTEHFDYPTPAFIGGNGDAGSSSNNWTTHSVTAGQTTTIDIQDGSLTYDGFAGSTGNKVLLFGNRNATSRDVNRPLASTTAKVAYFSALINIVDTVQLKVAGDYFMSFGGAVGSAISLLGARFGAKLTATPTATTFRFFIQNNSGGTPSITDNGADLNIGTTYLVVVKYDISAPLSVATMWINPASLGGSEPSGGISNNTGTNTFTTFASICLRNTGGTPKVNVDEIRVGVTWADVTPFSGVGISNKVQAARQSSIYPNPATAYFNVKAPEGKYLVSVNNSIGTLVKTADLNSTGKIEIMDLSSGLYFVTVENLNTKQKEVHKLMVK